MGSYWLIRLYTACLRLYPRPHQAEFGEEMRETFCGAVEEADQQNRLTLMTLCCREIATLPAALWQSDCQAALAKNARRTKSPIAGNAGMSAEAGDHALASCDFAHAVRLLEEHAMLLMTQGRAKLLEEWMRVITAGWHLTMSLRC